MPRKLFRDRHDAGRQLAERLRSFQSVSPIVLGLPRGGVPVAYEVARELEAPLDICVVRKIGAPLQPELGLGAIGEDGALYLDHRTMAMAGVAEDDLLSIIVAKRLEVADAIQRFRRGTRPVDVRGKTAIIVDDGIATGGTMRAAITSLRGRGANRVVVATPIAAKETIEALERIADDVVCLYAETPFYAVGLWYDDFEQTSDETVLELLARSSTEREAPDELAESPARAQAVEATPGRRDERQLDERSVHIRIGDKWLDGNLVIPPESIGIVLFAHGSGSGRHSSRNRYVASELQRQGVATLLFDLLTEAEERVDSLTAQLRFDIELLAMRLVGATDWVLQRADTKNLQIAYFGASTGAGAALLAATHRPRVVRAVVSRGGRPDLADRALHLVRASTLLIVGGDDEDVLRLNIEALSKMRCTKRLEIIDGATHLFEEPGALQQVAHLASSWFARHFRAHRAQGHAAWASR